MSRMPGAAILFVSTVISLARADSLVPDRDAPVIRVQAVDPALCRRRCDFDYETCVQVVRDTDRDPFDPSKHSEYFQLELDACAKGRESEKNR
jgi:hypothetical protein